MMSEITGYNEKTFENIKHVTDEGEEFWTARELQVVLEYSKWGNFNKVIDKAKEACINSDVNVNYHFADVSKTIKMPKNATKEIDDVILSRYACYLIVQNSDPRKKVVALGQTYFAVKTREKEIDDFKNNTEDGRRLELRHSIKGFNKRLADAASGAGVINFGKFQNYGYRGLYNGEDAKGIKARKNLSKNEDILDHMGATELAANYFRITQTEEKIINDNIKGEDNANITHFNVGRKVRKTMIEISGKAPENLPTPEKSIKQIEKEQNKKQLPEKE
jgi:DNA-damage-inducible protein D